MTAFDRLIADYQSADNHLASDGYNNRQADQLIADARAEREELVEVCRLALERLERHEFADASDIGWSPATEALRAVLEKHAPQNPLANSHASE